MDLKRPAKFSTKKKRKFWEGRERKCFWCSKNLTDENKTIDHVVPQSYGGGHNPENLVACCLGCNIQRSDVHARPRTGRGGADRHAAD